MIVSFFEIEESEKVIFQEALKTETLIFFDKAIQEVPITEYQNSDVISVFIRSKVTSDILTKLNNLKLVTTRSTGMDHIDISYCKEHSITIKNVPLYGENTVAEHTFALILSLSRKIRKSYLRVVEGSFSTQGLQGFDLKNKTIGIVGGGRIGMHVARMARSFGMHVRVYDIHQDDFLAEIINFKYRTLDELLAESDIISLHVPYNTHTHHLINAESISKMKNGSILINTARGALVDTDSLVSAINSGKLSGAGLDVIEGEEYFMEENLYNSPVEKAAKVIVQSKQLLDNENVVITPHNAFNSTEASRRILDRTIENIKEL